MIGDDDVVDDGDDDDDNDDDDGDDDDGDVADQVDDTDGQGYDRSDTIVMLISATGVSRRCSRNDADHVYGR